MAVARIFQAGAFVAYTSSGEVELTQLLEDDLSLFTDSISTSLAGIQTLSLEDDLAVFSDDIATQLFGILSLSVSEDVDELSDAILFFTPTLIFTDSINNLADELAAIGFDYALVLTDGLPAISDGLILSFLYSLEISDNLSLFTDAITSLLFGTPSSVFAENINNYSDDVGMILGMHLLLEDRILTSFNKDSINLVKETQFGVLEDSVNTLDDTFGISLQAELTLSMEDNINNLTDEVETSTSDLRSIGANRTTFLSYIRRYLNDAGTN